MTLQKSALLFAFAVLVAPENSIASESSSNWVCVGALGPLAAHVVILEGQVILVQDVFISSARCDGD